MSDESVCSVCSRLTGFGDEDKGEPPVNLARCPAPGGTECRAVAQAVAPWRRENETLRSNCDHLSSENASRAVDEWKAANGYNDLLAVYSASVSETNRLRKLFDDAGQGEHNVLALIDHYQRNSMDADERIRAVRKLLEENGCDCPCDHHPDERGDDCEVCLACRIGEAVGK